MNLKTSRGEWGRSEKFQGAGKLELKKGRGEGEWDVLLFLLLRIQLNVISKREQNKRKRISQILEILVIFLFWLSWALNCHASIRMVSIRARLLLKMSKSNRTRNHIQSAKISLASNFYLYSFKVVDVFRVAFSTKRGEKYSAIKQKRFPLNLVNFSFVSQIEEN